MILSAGILIGQLVVERLQTLSLYVTGRQLELVAVLMELIERAVRSKTAMPVFQYILSQKDDDGGGGVRHRFRNNFVSVFGGDPPVDAVKKTETLYAPYLRMSEDPDDVAKRIKAVIKDDHELAVIPHLLDTARRLTYVGRTSGRPSEMRQNTAAVNRAIRAHRDGNLPARVMSFIDNKIDDKDVDPDTITVETFTALATRSLAEGRFYENLLHVLFPSGLNRLVSDPNTPDRQTPGVTILRALRLLPAPLGMNPRTYDLDATIIDVVVSGPLIPEESKTDVKRALGETSGSIDSIYLWIKRLGIIVLYAWTMVRLSMGGITQAEKEDHVAWLTMRSNWVAVRNSAEIKLDFLDSATSFFFL